MSWTRKISHANELLKKGDPISCQVISVDQERKRIALGLKQLAGDPWETTIPEKYQPGSQVIGKVTKITNFGVFVELEPELEGLLHVSELSDQKVENPETFVKVGQELDVRILRIDSNDRKIGLSRRSTVEIQAAVAAAAAGESKGESQASAPKTRVELKGGMEGASGPLFTMGGPEEVAAPPVESVAVPPEEPAE